MYNFKKMKRTMKRKTASIVTFVFLFSMILANSITTVSAATGIQINGDFETGTATGWGAFGSCSVQAVNTQAQSGSYSAYVSNRTESWQGISQDVFNKMVPGVTYDVSAWIKLDSDTIAEPMLQVKRTEDGTTSYDYINKIAATNQWMKVSGTYKYDPKGTVTELTFYIAGPEAGVGFYVDNIAITPQTVVETPNQITNSSFEQGTLGWSSFGPSTVVAATTQAQSGDYSAYVSNRTESWQGICQSLLGKLTPGVTYPVSAWVRLENAEVGEIMLQMKITAGDTTDYPYIGKSVATSTDWVQISGTYKYDPAGTVTDLLFYIAGPDAGVNFYVDNVVFGAAASNTPVPTATATPNTKKISGYVLPDVEFEASAASLGKSGFTVTMDNIHSAKTNENGYFEIGGLTADKALHNVKISKTGYLTREIGNIELTGNVQLGTKDSPVGIWAGDVDQDSAVNMVDIMQVATAFGSTATSSNYKITYDYNLDKAINMNDIMIVAKHFNATVQSYGVVTPIYNQANLVAAKVNTAVKHQTMEGFGASIAYYQSWLTAHPNKAEIYHAIFKDLGTSVLRLNNWYYTNEGQTNFDPEAKEIVAEAGKSLGQPVKVMMSSWTPPLYIKSNNSKAGGTLAKENGQFVYGKFADYWYNSLKAYEAIGVKPSYISIQNEPDIATDYESCVFDATEGTNASYGKALDAVYNKLKTMTNAPKIVGPEVLGIGYNNLQKYIGGMNLDQVDALGFHLYHGSDENNEYPDLINTPLTTIAKTYASKPKYQTEYYRGSAFNTAWMMHNNLATGNVNMYLYWNLIWDKDGLVTLENPWDRSKWTTSNGYILTDSYYAFKQFSKFIQPGYTRVDASTDVSSVKMTAYVSPDNKSMTIVLLNTSAEDQKVALDLSSFTYSSSEIYRTSATEKFASVGSLGSEKSVLLPSKSIATVVIK